MKKILSVVAGIAGVCCALQAQDVSGLEESEAGGIQFDAGADLRIRQEILHNVPTMPGGGMVGNPAVTRTKTKNQLRFRPRVWAEVKFGDSWRLYGRLVDEFRAGIVQKTHAQTWPGEVVVDNIYLEGKHLLDGVFFDEGWVDVVAGRQDLYGLYGLNHIFVDGTAGDGSRTTFADMVRLAIHVDEDSWLDLFGMINKDREYMRLGTKRSQRGTQLTGFGGNDTEMDDWGFGAVWNSKFTAFADASARGLPVNYQLFFIQKDTASFHRRGVKHPRRQVNLIGAKLVPHWTENLTTPLEAMVQVGENGENKDLTAWAGYAGVEWKDMSKKTWRPFAGAGLLVLSGDEDAAREDGGRSAWDPMWYRGVNDSEMMLYGSNYGSGWWSNMMNLKTTFGVEISRLHKVSMMMGPIFAEAKDGLGGGDGQYKGFLSQARYDFPLWRADAAKGERFEIFGHLLFECFNPGDYYETSKPAYFVRWQVDFKF